MIQLESYFVQGFRALADTDEIPVRAPTILTGGNDGGKTSAIEALRFLLEGTRPGEGDYTQYGTSEEGATETLRAEQISVTGSFRADEEFSKTLGLRGRFQLRRVVTPGSLPRCELLEQVPADPDLRGLANMKIAELKELARRRKIEPEGKASARDSWLTPLQALAAADEQIDDWAEAPSSLVTSLPRMLVFSSTEEPDPEGQIRSALKVVFDQVLDSYTGPVREAEHNVREKLIEEAKKLCEHISEQCPELSEITVVPDVAFKEGFRSVEVRASRGKMTGIALEKSGAGRRRRVNLAIWEWVEKLLEETPDDDRTVVIAYDEPDTHLDYGHQRELVSLIQRQCERNGTRMIVATHSLNLIDRVSISDVVHLRLENEHTRVERLVGEEHEKTQRYLASVSAAMGLRNSVLLHERCFVGVEGATEMGALPLLFRLATGMSLQSAGIALIAGNGNEGALRVAQFLNEHQRKLAFLVDTDSQSGSTRRLFRKEKLEQIGIKEEQVHYLGKAELEDLFSLEQWLAVAQQRWNRDDGRNWAEEDFAPIPCGKKFSGALMNVIRGGSSSAPRSKPGYLIALAEGLEKSEEVPKGLQLVFDQLVELAAGESAS